MPEPTAEELKKLVKDELYRIYGRKYAEMCILEYRGSWFYFSEPIKRAKGDLAINPLSKPMQRREILNLIFAQK